MQIRLEQTDFGKLAICAIRYCHGRMSYMPSLVQGILRNHLKELSDKDLGVMIEDCEFQRRTDLYGDPVVDKPDWLRWENDLRNEKKRREEKAHESVGN